MSDSRDVTRFVEGADPAAICLPDRPSVRVSKSCADTDTGRGWIRALVTAARDEWMTRG